MVNLSDINENIRELMIKICDVEFCYDFEEINDEDGHAVYNMNGKTFAYDGSGGEFILLEDESVAYHGSEGEVGKISTSFHDYMEFMINCPYWMDYLRKDMYISENLMDNMIARNSLALGQMLNEEGINLLEQQIVLASYFSCKLYDDKKNVLRKFYDSVHSLQKFVLTYTEDDGEVHISSGDIFD